MKLSIEFPRIDWGEWALPLEIFKIPGGLAFRVFVFEVWLCWETK